MKRKHSVSVFFPVTPFVSNQSLRVLYEQGVIEWRTYEYNEKLHNFYYLRLAFGILVLSNSVLIAEDWTIRGVALYAVYFIPVVAWFEIFYSTRFKTALLIGLISACNAMVNALIFKPHPFLWVYAILFSSFITYISAYFEYCVVKN
jgi:hypothetical protein